MKIRIYLHVDGTSFTLEHVETLRLVHVGEVGVKCFGNDEVIHRGVSEVVIEEMGYELL